MRLLIGLRSVNMQSMISIYSSLAALLSHDARRSFKASVNGDAEAPFIPKRGDKDFTPVQAFANTQQAALQASRDAMFSALQAGQARQHSSKMHNKAVWHPELCRASMPTTGVYGVHFNTMGHYEALRQRMELLPEEALYLVERGTLECWTEQQVAMSAQHAFASMMGTDELTMERYQVSHFSCYKFHAYARGRRCTPT